MAPPRSSPDRPDDGQRTDVLLGRARSGDQEAWRLLFLRYRPMLEAHVESRLRGFMRQRLDAEDVLQNAFMRAWQSQDSFEYRGEGSFRRWLARVVVNSCTDTLAQNNSGFLRVGASEQALSDQAERDADERRETEERKGALLEALGQLTDEDRDIVIQRKVEDLSFETIGQNLGCSREKAREMFGKAMERLQHLLRH